MSYCCKTARSITDIPLSVDTLGPDLINAAVDSGIDIVLSLNSGNIPDVRIISSVIQPHLYYS